MTDISELEGLRTLISNVRIYIEDAQKIAIVMKGDSLLRNNMNAYTSAQGAIDILLDINSILAGKTIPSIEQIRKEMEEEQINAKSDTVDGGTPYTY